MSVCKLMPRIPDTIHLPGDSEAHIWTAFLSECLQQLGYYAQLLSLEERDKADRFHRPDDRARSIVSHGILRYLLGTYLSVEPAELGFVQNVFGKPSLVHCHGRPVLSFNLSHSGDVILFAVTGDHRIGVDIERIRESSELMEVARAQFSEREFNALQGLAKEEQTGAFFRCWTRKEAYIKARGEGLGFPLRQFSMSIGRVDPPVVLWVADDPEAAGRWSVSDFSDLAGYAGAVVCEGGSTRFVRRRWMVAD